MLALEDGFQARLSINTVQYKIDNGEWTSLASNTYTPTVNAGQRIYFKGNLTPTSSKGIGTFVTNKKYNLEGNCMSMLFGDEAEGKTDLTDNDDAFCCLFENNYYLNEVSSDFLPATTLAEYCYSGMFAGCTSLVTAPELPATTLAYGCYSNMFNGCTSLVTAPKLPATTLKDSCYNRMFNSCSKLNSITMLATDISACYCLYDWVEGVASTGTFTNAASMTSLPSGVHGIPEGWVVENGNVLFR